MFLVLSFPLLLLAGGQSGFFVWQKDSNGRVQAEEKFFSRKPCKTRKFVLHHGGHTGFMIPADDRAVPARGCKPAVIERPSEEWNNRSGLRENIWEISRGAQVFF